MQKTSSFLSRSPFAGFRRLCYAFGILSSTLLYVSHPYVAYAETAEEEEAEDEQPALTPEVGKVLEAAQAALEEKNATLALDEVTKASKMPNTNAFDNYMIQRIRAAACTQKEEIGCALSAYDSLLGNPQTQPDEKKRMLSAIAALAYRAQDYQKCEKTALNYLEHESYDPVMASLAVQCPYVAQNWAETVRASKSLSVLSQKYKKPVSEASLQMLAVAYGNLGKAEEERETYTVLAETYPNPRYWEFLLHEFMSDTKMPQRLRFNVMRLRLATGAGKLEPKEFQDMAERAVQMEVPSLAVKFLQIGYDKKILGQGTLQQSEEEQRFKTFIQQQAYKAHRGLNQAIVQARKSSSAGALLSAGYELALEGHAAAGLSVMREGMENHPNYPEIAELEYAMAELDVGQKSAAIRHLENISGNGPAHALGQLWVKELQSQGRK
ncbi:hypothetical protein FAI41_05875 [Acetobacteraceae bacterium]|nr:hypothetical protein FAI41_05875 [Acetobacteraceae bacterium]